MTLELLTLATSNSGTIHVRPRWPYRQVLIDPEAHDRLKHAQKLLGSDLQLVLTRAFEPGGKLLRTSHRIGRWIGSLIFLALHPSRSSERWEIFSSNGHDQDGTHVDLSVMREGRDLRLLKRGVFTTRQQAMMICQSERLSLDRVYEALEEAGFKVHENLIESLQIHCDMRFER